MSTKCKHCGWQIKQYQHASRAHWQHVAGGYVQCHPNSTTDSRTAEPMTEEIEQDEEIEQVSDNSPAHARCPECGKDALWLETMVIFDLPYDDKFGFQQHDQLSQSDEYNLGCQYCDWESGMTRGIKIDDLLIKLHFEKEMANE